MKIEDHDKTSKLKIEFEKTKKKFIHYFIVYLLIGSVLLYISGRMCKKDKNSVRVVEFQAYPFECLNFNIYTFNEYYNDTYLNKIVKKFLVLILKAFS